MARGGWYHSTRMARDDEPVPRADVELTTRLREVGDLCGIPVLDHVVVGFEGYSSLAERGWR